MFLPLRISFRQRVGRLGQERPFLMQELSQGLSGNGYAVMAVYIGLKEVRRGDVPV
jgi:hypothetical protein